MKIKFIIFILAFMFISGCMTTNTYHINKLQIFSTKDGKQFFMFEKENISGKINKDLKKSLSMTFVELQKEFDALD